MAKQAQNSDPAKHPDDGFAAVVFCGADGKLLYADPALSSALAHSAEELKALALFDLLAGSHAQTAAEALHAADGSRDLRAALCRKDGTELPAALTVHPVACGGKQYRLVQLQSSGGNSRRQTEARYHLIFNSVPVGISLSDKEGNFYAFNPAFSEMLGFSSAKLRKMKAQSVYQNTDDRKRLMEALRAGVSRLEVAHLGQIMRACTISIGVASFPQNGQTADALLKAADEALYTAKRKGRNRVVASMSG